MSVPLGDGLDLPDEPEMLGTKDLAVMWCLSQEYVTNHVTKLPDFPPPALNLTRKTRRWRRADAEAWRVKHSGR